MMCAGRRYVGKVLRSGLCDLWSGRSSQVNNPVSAQQAQASQPEYRGGNSKISHFKNPALVARAGLPESVNETLTGEFHRPPMRRSTTSAARSPLRATRTRCGWKRWTARRMRSSAASSSWRPARANKDRWKRFQRSAPDDNGPDCSEPLILGSAVTWLLSCRKPARPAAFPSWHRRLRRGRCRCS